MQRLMDAARALDSGAVAGIVRTMMAERGVADVWTDVCVPALCRLSEEDIVVEHVLAEGIARGLDLVSAPRHDDIRTNHVLLACAPRESHSLPLRALAAALFEHRVGTFMLGAQVPWTALRAAVRRTVPGTAVVWAQTPASADAEALLAVADRFPGTRFAAAGPGWGALPVELPRLTSMDMAVSACTRVPATLDMEA